MSKKITILIATLALVVFGVVMFRSPAPKELGGQFEERNHKTFLQGFVSNGSAVIGGQTTLDGGVLYSSTFATTSAGTVTYTAASVTNVNTILHNVTGTATGNLPASTTLTSFVPNVGDRRSIVLVNTGTGVLTVSGGTGTLLNKASTSAAVIGGGSAILEFVRKTNTDVVVFMTPGI